YWAYFIICRGRGSLLMTEVFNLYTHWSNLKAVVAGFIPIEMPFNVTSKIAGANSQLRHLAAAYMLTAISLCSVVMAFVRWSEGHRTFSLLFVLAFTCIYLGIGVYAIMFAKKKPFSTEVYSFFDYRPVEVGSVNGNSLSQSHPGVAIVISEKSLRFTSVSAL